jgi:hypothetical protein
MGREKTSTYKNILFCSDEDISSVSYHYAHCRLLVEESATPGALDKNAVGAWCELGSLGCNDFTCPIE